MIERAWAYIAHRADECERGRDGNERARSARRLFLVFLRSRARSKSTRTDMWVALVFDT